MPGQVVDHKREEAEQERPGNRDCRDASSRHRIPSTVVNGHEDPLVTTTDPSVGYLRGRPRPSRSRAASESPRVGVTISLGMFGAGALLDGAAERTHRAILGCGARWFWACAPSLPARTVYTARVLMSDPGRSPCVRGAQSSASLWGLRYPIFTRLAVVLRIWVVFGECGACNLLIIKDRVLLEMNVVP